LWLLGFLWLIWLLWLFKLLWLLYLNILSCFDFQYFTVICHYIKLIFRSLHTRAIYKLKW
jgi:hypothetical protein